MSVETITYFATFIVTAGIAALAIVLSVQLHQQYKKPVLAHLLYHQIFLFSFMIYSVWGNILLKTILKDVHMTASLSSKLAVIVPMLGLPFMLVSWFMLLKIACELNGFKGTKTLGFIFFPTLVVLILAIDLLIFFEIMPVPKNADLFIIRVLTALNLFIYLIFSTLFFIQERKRPENKSGINKQTVLLLLLVLAVSSLAMNFFMLFGFISICISIVLAFAAGAFLPAIIYFRNQFSAPKRNLNFDDFCAFYDISKREAEVVNEICNGLSNREIADKLFITLQTVKDHNHRIFTKTDVKSRVQLANLVREKTGQKT